MPPLVPVVFRTHKLPAMLLREVGRVVTVFAAIEHELNLTAYTLLRLSPAEGRLAVTRQNIRSRMDLLNSLLQLHHFPVPDDWSAMSNGLQNLEEIRDWVAHGAWSLQDGAPVLQITRGKWIPAGYGSKVDRKVVPAGAPIRYQTLRGTALAAIDLLACDNECEGFLSLAPAINNNLWAAVACLTTFKSVNPAKAIVLTVDDEVVAIVCGGRAYCRHVGQGVNNALEMRARVDGNDGGRSLVTFFR